MINGVIADYANMQTMIFEFLEKYSKGKVRGQNMCRCRFHTQCEVRGIFDILQRVGKTKGVLLCEKPCRCRWIRVMSNEPTGVMVVDIGTDTTEISVMSLGGLVLSDLLHLEKPDY